MLAEQLSLDYSRPVAAPPPAAPDEVSAFESFLRGRGWVRAVEIIRANPPELRLPANVERAKRKLRTIAEAGRRSILSFPGSPGYLARRDATVEQIQHSARAHRSQARRHIAAAIEDLKYLHGTK